MIAELTIILESENMSKASMHIHGSRTTLTAITAVRVCARPL